MTKKEAVVIEAYTGVCMLKGEDRNLFYKYINQLMGRKVYTHELPVLINEIKEKAKPDFIKICKNMDKKTKTRKFRAMTIGEYCDIGRVGRTECKYCEYNRGLYYCDYSVFNQVNRWREKNKPYKTKGGKYILREVKE